MEQRFSAVVWELRNCPYQNRIVSDFSMKSWIRLPGAQREEQGLQFESKCDSALREIVSDKLKLKQIAANLLSDAIKYRKPSRAGYVSISFAASGETSWKIVVADVGIAKAVADMEALFGQFSRVQSTSAVTGTGLGLAICKEFAELLGGHVEVRSEAQQGTRFEVTLPMSARNAGRWSEPLLTSSPRSDC